MNDETLTQKLTGGDNYWFPQAANEYARKVDFMHDVITYVSIFLFLGLICTAFYFSFRYRERKNNMIAKKQISHNAKLEFAWIFLPFLASMVLFGWGFKDYLQRHFT